MKIKSNIFTQLPKTPAGKEVYSFFLPKRYKLLMEKCMHDALDDYAAKVSKWNPEAGKVLDRPGIYDKTPFGADNQLYTDLRIWHSSVKPKGKVSFGEFSSYVDKAAANDEKTDYHPTAPTGVSQPLRLLLKCAWNLAYERGAGNATCRGFEIPGEGKAKAL